jgi:C-terminal processing protease CtpA/Prc
MDKGTASAGEAFVLSMKANSNKIMVYGESSYGMIDYMNINTQKINCTGNSSYYYGYPTFFAPSIKTEPINPTGIKPDVYIPTGTLDWIKWVMLDLAKK